MGKSRIVRLIIALVAAIAAGIGAAILAAVVLAIVELYLAGHSLPKLSQQWLGSGFLRMSVADALFRAFTLVSAAGAGALVYSVLRPSAPDGSSG